jgi:hypothetical protein
VRAADCRATALLAKRATVVRIMVNALFNLVSVKITRRSSGKETKERQPRLEQNFYD